MQSHTSKKLLTLWNPWGLQKLGTVCPSCAFSLHKAYRRFTKKINKSPEPCWLWCRPEEGNRSHTIGTSNSYWSFPSSCTQNTVCARKTNAAGFTWWTLISAKGQQGRGRDKTPCFGEVKPNTEAQTPGREGKGDPRKPYPQSHTPRSQGHGACLRQES